MKLSVTKSSLLAGLQMVHNVVTPRTTLPILANALMVAEKNKLWLTTTDLDLTVRCCVEAEVQKTGSSTLPVRRLANIVRELPDANIEIDIDDKDISSISCGSAFFKLNGMSDQEFPPVLKADGKYAYRLDQGAFKQMLKKCSYSSSKDESRYVLNGVLLSFKNGKLTIVATDGRRLALVEHEIEFPSEAECEVILPTKAVTELEQILGDEGELKISVKDKQAVFEFKDVIVASKLIDGVYPNYKQVIPAQCEERITLERETLLAALRRVSLLATEKANATKLTFAKNKLTITMSAPDIGEARETLPVKYTGKELSVAFNAEYMIDPLKILTNDEVFLELTDDLSPGVIKCDIPFLYVLMPIKIS
jgi:DNA polymerase-3 subunit beta